jgi:hypothetical protein
VHVCLQQVLRTAWKTMSKEIQDDSWMTSQKPGSDHFLYMCQNLFLLGAWRFLWMVFYFVFKIKT